jgi:lysophospholipase L1-like esterase
MPFIFLLIIELFLRLFNYGDNLSLFIDFPVEEFKDYRIVNQKIGKKYFQIIPYTEPVHDKFLKKKRENGYRVFVMGSSTVYGFPYTENLVFSRILQKRFQDAYPEKYMEIINTAITAINSYTLLDFVDEILDEEPDAILFYAGHNEFYGAFGIGSIEKSNTQRIFTFIHLELLSLKIYQFLNNQIANIRVSISADKSEKSVKGTLMRHIAENREIPYKSEIYEEAMKIFERNLDDIISKLRKKGVPLFISEVISNVKDLEPFCSVDHTKYPSSISIYDKSKTKEKDGNFKDAKSEYYQAKDLDCIRFRASEEVNDIIRALADKHDVNLVPMVSYFEGASPNELIGNNLLTEHVHPNIEGNFIMADAFYKELTASELIGKKLNPILEKSSSYYRLNWGYTKLDSILGVHKVNNLRSYWPFQSLDNPISLDYRDTCKPRSFIDSLSFEVFKSGTIGINDAHLVLADRYKKNGDYFKAFKEYYATISYFPYRVKDYLEAGTCLMQIKDYNLAFELFTKSLEIRGNLLRVS